MRKIAYIAAGCAALLTSSAFAQDAPYSLRDDDQAAGRPGEIERQIQELDDSIHAADRQGRISPSQADTYVRELREIETQLLDVRARTFNEPRNDDDRQPAEAPTYGGTAPYTIPDDQRDNGDPAPTPDSGESGSKSPEYL